MPIDFLSPTNRIREKKQLMKMEAGIKKSSTKPKLPRTAKTRERSVSRLRSEFRNLGVELDSDGDEMHLENAVSERKMRPLKRKREDSEGRVRSSSRTPRDQSGIRDAKVRTKVKKLSHKSQGKMNKDARKGEADRKILNSKPKHLFTGKRGIGKTSRR